MSIIRFFTVVFVLILISSTTSCQAQPCDSEIQKALYNFVGFDKGWEVHQLYYIKLAKDGDQLKVEKLLSNRERKVHSELWDFEFPESGCESNYELIFIDIENQINLIE